MLAQVGDNSARREDLLRERREWTKSRLSGGSAQQAGGEIEGHVIAIVHHGESVGRRCRAS
jgi:hypothetical protein